ncbi:hypothetical protein GLOIN_2v1772385 [Rhizophagus clarus]|uniref:Uncharacterized protein n=1 Tax=Rhizophagus clarus TaxID=94130 RepID=A0A8H3LWK0_9GLOM|nr:hypothetical protein GLOIN_2v1772385 [Rhizophagus clarus]
MIQLKISYVNVSIYKILLKHIALHDNIVFSPARFSSDIFEEIHWIPDPQKSSGHNTTENDCPSKQSRKNKKEYAPQGMFISGQIRDFISCKSCKKPHCIFSKNALSEKEQEDLEISFEQYHYTCGSKL